MEEFIKEDWWNVVKRGVCGVIDVNVGDVGIDGEKECDILELVGGMIGRMMMMLGGMRWIMIMLRG